MDNKKPRKIGIENTGPTAKVRDGVLAEEGYGGFVEGGDMESDEYKKWCKKMNILRQQIKKREKKNGE